MSRFQDFSESRPISYDRFIQQISPNHLKFTIENDNSSSYEKYLKNQMLESKKKEMSRPSRMFEFSPVSKLLKNSSESKSTKKHQVQEFKAIKSCRIPEMLNCFSLNLIDWGPHNNIAVAIKNKLFLWASQKQAARIFKKLSFGCVSCVKSNSGNLIALGSTKNGIGIYDLQKKEKVSVKK